MIERYARPEMGAIWTEQNKFNIWLKIEILACEAQSRLGLIPENALAEIKSKAQCSAERIGEIEKTTKHDVIAFLTNVEENVGEASRYIHLGLTSSDVLDTCLGYQIKLAGEILLRGVNSLIEALARKAREHKYDVCVGRSHGIHAEPTTFGFKCALWLEEARRCKTRLNEAISSAACGKISGAVGTYEHLSPEVEQYVCEKLGITPAPISTQVVSRDRHANFQLALAQTGGLLEKIALEVRHLQRTEVLEVEERFSKGQKGSSAMPHKRNPIVSENICGLARLLRTNALAAMENNALWHERDISHSSVERVIMPDSTIILDTILHRGTNLVENLVVYPEKMKTNLNITNGLIFSQKAMLELIKKGLKRQRAYEIVQESAMKTWETGAPFRETLVENSDFTAHFKEREIDAMFNYDNLFKNIDIIFERLGLGND